MPSNEITISASDIEALGKDLDELRDRIVADLGERDREYIYSIIKTQRGCEAAGRALM